MLFVKAIEVYLDWKRTHTIAAFKAYAVWLYRMSKVVGKDKLLADVTGDDVVAFQRYLDNMLDKNGKKKYSQVSIAYSARIMKNFFMFWLGRGECRVNPKEIRHVKFVSPLRKIVTDQEFEIMATNLPEARLPDIVKKLVVHLLWDTGMRISELRDLNISNINDVNPEYGLRTAYVRTRKTMNYNVVAWSKRTNDLLNKYLGFRLCMDDVTTNALFVNLHRYEPDRISLRGLQRWVREAIATCNLNGAISAHSFRHGKAHCVLNSKESNIRDVAAILRHSDPKSSFHYLNLNEAQFLKTASKYLET